STAVIVALILALARESWIDADAPLPNWSYFAFAQNIFMILRGSLGAHWLWPSWTLVLEEQFYLFAPFLFLVLPQRSWLPVLAGLCLAGLALRAAGVLSGAVSVAPLALLPTSADVLCVGLVLAVLVKRDVVPWARFSTALRAAPILFLVLAFVTQRLDGGVV